MTLPVHEWHPFSRFCCRCGVALQDVIDERDRQCPPAGNVRAISHLIATRRLVTVAGRFVRR